MTHQSSMMQTAARSPSPQDPAAPADVAPGSPLLHALSTPPSAGPSTPMYTAHTPHPSPRISPPAHPLPPNLSGPSTPPHPSCSLQKPRSTPSLPPLPAYASSHCPVPCIADDPRDSDGPPAHILPRPSVSPAIPRSSPCSDPCSALPIPPFLPQPHTGIDPAGWTSPPPHDSSSVPLPPTTLSPLPASLPAPRTASAPSPHILPLPASSPDPTTTAIAPPLPLATSSAPPPPSLYPSPLKTAAEVMIPQPYDRPLIEQVPPVLYRNMQTPSIFQHREHQLILARQLTVILPPEPQSLQLHYLRLRRVLKPEHHVEQ